MWWAAAAWCPRATPPVSETLSRTAGWAAGQPVVVVTGCGCSSVSRQVCRNGLTQLARLCCAPPIPPADISTFECAATFNRKNKKFRQGCCCCTACKLDRPRHSLQLALLVAAVCSCLHSGFFCSAAATPPSCPFPRTFRTLCRPSRQRAPRARARLPPTARVRWGGVWGLHVTGDVRGCCCMQAFALRPAAAASLLHIPPTTLRLLLQPACAAGKGKVGEASAAAAAAASAFPGDDGIALATMDIFAGCGGLSEGMHQAGERCGAGGVWLLPEWLLMPGPRRMVASHLLLALPSHLPPHPASTCRRRCGQVGH